MQLIIQIPCYADIIVNTDADNQYCADDIPALIAPILWGNADIVVGTRAMHAIMTYTPFRFFAVPGIGAFLAGFLLGLRFIYDFITLQMVNILVEKKNERC
jgi:hypothetical protein